MPLVQKPFGDIITFTRASGGTYFDSAGTLQTASNDVARLDYDPSTLAARGFLIEEQRTNSIRNNTMQGAVAGTPGTAPTNWSVGAGANGLTRSIATPGSINGISCLDITLAGTASASSTHSTSFDAANAVAASSGQVWTGSVFLSLAAGSMTGISEIRINQFYYDATPTFLSNQSSADIKSQITSTLQRFSFTATVPAGVSFVRLVLVVAYTNGSAVDITLRIGLPQLEQGAFATSVIATTGSAATRSADVASVNTLSPWYNANEGTLYGQVTLLSSSYTSGVFLDIGAGGAFGTTEYIGWDGTKWVLNPNSAPINVSSQVTTTSTAKVAGRLVANNSILAANGTLGTADTSCAIPSSPTRLTIGAKGWSTAGSGNFLNGHIQRIAYYPRGFSDAELQAITT